jgi:hypothetical protein
MQLWWLEENPLQTEAIPSTMVFSWAKYTHSLSNTFNKCCLLDWAYVTSAKGTEELSFPDNRHQQHILAHILKLMQTLLLFISWLICEMWRLTIKETWHGLIIFTMYCYDSYKKRFCRPTIQFFRNPILFAICTSTFSKLCKRHIEWHVEECSLALLCN